MSRDSDMDWESPVAASKKNTLNAKSDALEAEIQERLAQVGPIKRDELLAEARHTGLSQLKGHLDHYLDGKKGKHHQKNLGRRKKVQSE